MADAVYPLSLLLQTLLHVPTSAVVLPAKLMNVPLHAEGRIDVHAVDAFFRELIERRYYGRAHQETNGHLFSALAGPASQVLTMRLLQQPSTVLPCICCAYQSCGGGVLGLAACEGLQQCVASCPSIARPPAECRKCPTCPIRPGAGFQPAGWPAGALRPACRQRRGCRQRWRGLLWRRRPQQRPTIIRWEPHDAQQRGVTEPGRLARVRQTCLRKQRRLCRRAVGWQQQQHGRLQ